MLGATVYTFSINLAVFLGGLGIGSGVATHLARQMKGPRIALGVCQLLLAAAIAWTAYTLADALPNWPIDPLLARSAVFNFQVDIMRCMWAVPPAACLWGASFPLALAAAAEGSKDSGMLVGWVYGVNTVGGVVGALAFSIVLIPGIGTRDCQRLLIALAAMSALIVFAPIARSLGRRGAAVTVAAEVVQSMNAVNFHNATDVLATYAGRASDLKTWLAGADINEDMSLRLQYRAGMGLNINDPGSIYAGMLTYRRFPRELFTGSEQSVRALKDRLPTTNR